MYFIYYISFLKMVLTNVQKEKCEVLVARREKYFRKIQAVVDIAKNITKESVTLFRARLSKLDEIYSDFDRVCDEIDEFSATLEQEDKIDTKQSLKSFEELYYFVKSVALKYNVSPGVAATPPPGDFNSSGSGVGEIRVRLPKLDLPKFDGTLSSWPNFRDTYVALIHSNSSLKDIEKFHYLKASLSGWAAETISSVPSEAVSYSTAWETLLKNFDNNRLLASNYLDKILNFPPLKSESLSELKSFLSVFRENIAALNKLKIKDLGQFILLHIATNVLDSNTRYAFENAFKEEAFPSCDSLITFIESKCKILELSSKTPSGDVTQSRSTFRPPNPKSPKSRVYSSKVQSLVGSTISLICPFCRQSHKLVDCSKFLKENISKRFQFVKRMNFCFRCLSAGHKNSECPSSILCETCNQNHNRLLHFVKRREESTESAAKPASTPSITPEKSSTTALLQTSSLLTLSDDGLLGTAVLQIRDAFGTLVPFRAIVDTGSQRSYLTQSLASRLGFQKIKSQLSVAGIVEGAHAASKGVIESVICPRFDSKPEFPFRAEILNSVSSGDFNFPTFPLSPEIRQNIKGLELADPSFDVPGPIDGVIGSKIFCRSLKECQPYTKSTPAAISTDFGYVLMGDLPDSFPGLDESVSFFAPDLHTTLRNFWEIEEPSVKPLDHPEDILCENHFCSTYSRDDSGRYIVRLPFRDNLLPTDNRQLAMNRLCSQERRFVKQPSLGQQYNAFLKEYLDLGHMVPTSERSRYTIPHHAVFKPDSTTTKLRVVFDASAKQMGDVSLNDCLLTGPKLHKSLADIVCNFRLHKVAFTADISKMYRQIRIHPDDQPYQHIVWRRSPDLPIETFALQTVTYGTSCAPFLAIRTVREHAQVEGHKYPRAAFVLKEDIYVDDVVSGADSVEGALQLYKDITELCASGGFPLQKWLSNSPAFMSFISQNSDVQSFPLLSDTEGIHKILGLCWDPKLDVFTYSVCHEVGAFTKRSILSDIARIFDPLGYISPIIVFAKCLMQRLWQLKVGWDETIPSDLRSLWESFILELPLICKFSIPRLIPVLYSTQCQILGFADASERAYGCVIYVRTVDSSGVVQMHLLKSRSKVAPLKLLTIPRLELCAALLLVQTLIALEPCFQRYPPHSVHLWTDSTIVLAWLSLEPHSLKTFVAHRVVEITRAFPFSYWRHVGTEENPADIVSRGALPRQLEHCDLWWHGPKWALDPLDSWPNSRGTPTDLDLPEVKQVSLVAHSIETSSDLYKYFQNCSKLSRLSSRMAWVLRFIRNCKPCAKKIVGPLSLFEFRAALRKCVQVVQLVHFASEIKLIRASKPIQGSIKSLSPFLDSSGCLRVGGRLNNASLSWSKKHPLLLPKNSHLTKLIIEHYHVSYLHVGPRTLQSLLNREFWIMSGRSLIRKVVRSCPVCFRFRAQPSIPLMGDLPEARVSPPGRPFVHVGVDLAGPFNLRTSRLRKSPLVKGYFCMFVCLATKAVHLEVVSSLTTDAFLAALDRFLSRRGSGLNLYSDQGKNFIGAARRLKEVHELFMTFEDPLVRDQLSQREVVWHFNPPLSPNFGGLWEAAIKSVKSHLLRLTFDQSFTFEEFSTILTKIEAILNSRPLCPISPDPEDFDVLTPGHFLVGGPLVAIPEVPLNDVAMNRLSRWQLVQRITQGFWRRWSLEYLNTLQQRVKWTRSSPNLEPGTLVLVKSPGIPAVHWPTARVVDTHVGKDGVVRVVTLRTPSGEYKRPVSSLIPFPPATSV